MQYFSLLALSLLQVSCVCLAPSLFNMSVIEAEEKLEDLRLPNHDIAYHYAGSQKIWAALHFAESAKKLKKFRGKFEKSEYNKNALTE